MRKRQKLVLTTLLMTVATILVQLSPLEYKYPLIAAVAFLNYILAAWSLREGISGVEWLTILLPPVVFTAAVGLFYILLPPSILWRVVILIAYAVIEYFLLLTANVFSVAAIRTIALFRTGIVVSYICGLLLTGFLLYDTILSFRQPFWINILLVIPTSFVIILPNLWAVKLEEKLTREVLLYSAVLSLLTGLLAGAISIWPVTVLAGSTFLCTALYVGVGIVQHHFQEKLFSRTIMEYVVIGIAVLFTMLLTLVLFRV